MKTADWSFAGWSDGLSGTTNPATITINGNTAITAHFAQDEYTLGITEVGSGTVAVSPDQETYHYGDNVTLTATADAGWSFAGWSGDLSGGTNPATITINGNKTVTAYFVPDSDTIPPAEVTDLIAGSPTQNSIKLSWTSPGDDGSTGSQYDIRYSTLPINDGNWVSATQASGEPTPLVAGSAQSFTVTGLSPNITYYFALKTTDEVPNWSAVSNVPGGTTSADVSG